jgi:hypothetical protein
VETLAGFLVARRSPQAQQGGAAQPLGAIELVLFSCVFFRPLGCQTFIVLPLNFDGDHRISFSPSNAKRVSEGAKVFGHGCTDAATPPAC